MPSLALLSTFIELLVLHSTHKELLGPLLALQYVLSSLCQLALCPIKHGYEILWGPLDDLCSQVFRKYVKYFFGVDLLVIKSLEQSPQMIKESP